jgi:hypothetical protein
VPAVVGRLLVVSQGLATAGPRLTVAQATAPFIAVGILAGGLFSGAEGIKIVEQAQLFGGVAGEAYDHCYHKVCDTLANINGRRARPARGRRRPRDRRIRLLHARAKARAQAIASAPEGRETDEST